MLTFADVKRTFKKNKNMGWVKEPIKATEEIFNEVVNAFGKVWNGRIYGCSSPYEYFTDHLRDNYGLTLKQCDEICRMIKDYYGIKRFYYNEMN